MRRVPAVVISIVPIKRLRSGLREAGAEVVAIRLGRVGTDVGGGPKDAQAKVDALVHIILQHIRALVLRVCAADDGAQRHLHRWCVGVDALLLAGEGKAVALASPVACLLTVKQVCEAATGILHAGCGQEQCVPVGAGHLVALAAGHCCPFPLADVDEFLVLADAGEAPVAAPKRFNPDLCEVEVQTVAVALVCSDVRQRPSCAGGQPEVDVLVSVVVQRIVVQGDRNSCLSRIGIHFAIGLVDLVPLTKHIQEGQKACQ